MNFLIYKKSIHEYSTHVNKLSRRAAHFSFPRGSAASTGVLCPFLFLITFQWNVHTYSITANSMWLSEIVHESPLWINKETARKRGIKRGDLVEVKSPVGSVTARAFPVQGIHPQVVAIGGSCGHLGYGRVAQAEKFESRDPSTRLIWWEKGGNEANPSPVIPIAADPIGGGQPWDDTIVTIAKV